VSTFIVRARAGRTLAVVVVALVAVLLTIMLTVGSVFVVLVVRTGGWRWATVRHSSGATEELMTPSPRVERRRTLAFVVLASFLLFSTVLTEGRVAVALLFKAGQEIPKGSRVVHVIE
jgi:hypothetical protein